MGMVNSVDMEFSGALPRSATAKQSPSCRLPLTVGVSVLRADGVRVDLRWNLCDSRLGVAPASVSTSQRHPSPLIHGGSCPATRGLDIAGPPVIHERPRAIGRPLERSLRSGDEKFRRLGSATVVVSIGRWIGKGYCVHHRWYSRGCGAAVPWAAPPDRNRKDHGEATSVPLRLGQFIQLTIVPYFVSVQDCTVVK